MLKPFLLNCNKTLSNNLTSVATELSKRKYSREILLSLSKTTTVTIKMVPNYVFLMCLILLDFFPTAAKASGFVPCPVPILKNGRAKIQMKGKSVKFKCFRPYTLIGKFFKSIVAHCHSFTNETKLFQDDISNKLNGLEMAFGAHILA